MPKKQGRPRTGEDLIEFRVSTVLTKDEKDRLEAIAKEKRWSTATLIREALEKRYPDQIFLEDKR
jgi:predicted DNA-binding protein